MRVLSASRLIAALVFVGPHLGAQQLTRIERSRGFTMLDMVRQDIEKNYFDSTYGGIDLKKVFDSARARIEAADRLDRHRAFAHLRRRAERTVRLERAARAPFAIGDVAAAGHAAAGFVLAHPERPKPRPQRCP